MRERGGGEKERGRREETKVEDAKRLLFAFKVLSSLCGCKGRRAAGDACEKREKKEGGSAAAAAEDGQRETNEKAGRAGRGKQRDQRQV